MRYYAQKVQKYWKSKNGVKTAQNPLFKRFRAIFGKSGLLVYFWSQKIDQYYDISPRKSKNTESPKLMSKLLKTNYCRSYEQFLENLSYYRIFWNQKFYKKYDIRLKKSKNTESPKMVWKLLKIHYLRSYEQFLENRTW